MSKEEFWRAICFRNVNTVIAILKTHPEYVNERIHLGGTPLIFATQEEDLGMMEALIKARACLNDTSFGHTALAYAYHKENVDAIKLLLANGSPMDIEYLPLMNVACRIGLPEIVAITLVYRYHPHALADGFFNLENALEVARPYAIRCLGSYNRDTLSYDSRITDEYADQVMVGRGTKVALREPVPQFAPEDTTEEESTDVADATDVVLLASQVLLPAAEAGEAIPRAEIDYGAYHGALLGDLTVDWDSLVLETQ